MSELASAPPHGARSSAPLHAATPKSEGPPTSTFRGLSSIEAGERLAAVGPNEPVTAPRRSLLRQLLARLSNPLVLILALASGASAVLGNTANAAIIFSIVILSIGVELWQTRRSARAAEGLNRLVAQTAQVLRDGHWGEIPRGLLVPGDLIELEAGATVPADARLLEANDLHLSEAALTGESMPVEKHIGEVVLMGASVVSGKARAFVTLTGASTAFGEIAKTLNERPPATELERGIVRFGVFVLKTVVFLVLFVLVVNAVLRRDPLESLLFGVALAVGLTPEFLPMITTVTLTRGAERMAESKVIVKNLAAIQNLGSIDILCSDKTGTLTTAEMALEKCVDHLARPSERALLLAYVNSYFESGVDNPLDEAVLRHANLNPLDSAVLRHDHPDISGFTKLDEIPFDFERRSVSVLARRDDETLIITKGAPEQMLDRCSRVEAQGETTVLDLEARARCAATFRELGNEGYRVLAVAYGKRPNQRYLGKADERDLTLAGFLAFVDPPRDDARDVLSALGAAGVEVKILSGDSEQVTRHVCRQVGIPSEAILLGDDVQQMSDPALGVAAERARIFARLSPTQKSRVLGALRARGHVVGFLGDGINDAPSLRTADVGVSVSSATDVAKDAADVILLERGLGVLLAGILEGRKAFGNVMKYLLMSTSSSFGNVLSMALGSLFLPFLPLLPSQVLLNNFLYDLSQIPIPSDTVDADFVKKPRRWDIDVIRRFMLRIGPISSVYDLLTFYVLFKVFHADERLFHTGWFVESLVTQISVVYAIRTVKSPFENRPSRFLVLTSSAIGALGLALGFTGIGSYFEFQPLPPSFLLFLIFVTLTYLLCVDWVKRSVLRAAI
jgi:Mg2+-importing ATPase